MGSSDDILQKFIGKNIEDIETLARTVHFRATAETCKSNNHPLSDSAVTKEGVICVSYLAFQRFTNGDLVPKLLSLTFHELSHLRGFNEDEAVKLQLLFEDHGRIGEKVILADNDHYKTARKIIEKIGARASESLDALLADQEGACFTPNEVFSLSSDFDSDAFWLPSYLVKQIGDLVLVPLNGLNCNLNHNEGDRKQIVQVLKAVAEVDRLFEHFESPMCTGNLCMGRRWLEKNPEESLLKSEAVSKIFVPHRKLPMTNEKKIGCRLEDLSDKKVTDLIFKNGSSNLEGSAEKNLWFIEITSESASGLAEIRVWHHGLVQLLDADGFTSAKVSLTGYIQFGSKENISVHFATMNLNSRPIRDLEGHPEHSAADTTYPFVDPNSLFGGVITTTPTIAKEYILNCGLNLN